MSPFNEQDDKPTHRVHSREVKFKDKYGNEMTRYEEVHVPTQEIQDLSLKNKMGNLYDVVPTKDPIYQEIQKNSQQIIACPHSVAQRIIATHIRDVGGHYKWINGGEMLMAYLNRGDSDSVQLTAGFPTIPKIYVFWGYFEARNQYMPQMVGQMLGCRFSVGKHCWVFFPQGIETMTETWGPAIAELDYVPWVHVPNLDGEEPAPGPESTEAKIKIPTRNKEGHIPMKPGSPSGNFGSSSAPQEDSQGEPYDTKLGPQEKKKWSK